MSLIKFVRSWIEKIEYRVIVGGLNHQFEALEREVGRLRGISLMSIGVFSNSAVLAVFSEAGKRAHGTGISRVVVTARIPDSLESLHTLTLGIGKEISKISPEDFIAFSCPCSPSVYFGVENQIRVGTKDTNLFFCPDCEHFRAADPEDMQAASATIKECLVDLVAGSTTVEGDAILPSKISKKGAQDEGQTTAPTLVEVGVEDLLASISNPAGSA